MSTFVVSQEQSQWDAMENALFWMTELASAATWVEVEIGVASSHGHDRQDNDNKKVEISDTSVM